MRLKQLQEKNMPMNRKSKSRTDFTWGFEFEIAVNQRYMDSEFDYPNFDAARDAFDENFDVERAAEKIWEYKFIQILQDYNLKDGYDYSENDYTIIDLETDEEIDLEKCKTFRELQNYIDVEAEDIVDSDEQFGEWLENKTYYDPDNDNVFEQLKYSIEQDLDNMQLPEQPEWQIVEDTSIKPLGVEIVSPILNSDEAKISLKKIFDFIEDDDYLETNPSTGLHINVGTFSTDDIDILKFMVFFDDLYVLKQFNRENNSKYTRQLKDKIEKFIKKDVKITSEIDNKSFNDDLLNLFDQKYQSVNFLHLENENYLEIRAPGGVNYEQDLDKVLAIMKRIELALTVAMDENLYREEYLKKLGKLFNFDVTENYSELNKFLSKSNIIRLINNRELEAVLEELFFEKYSVQFYSLILFIK
jgi:hypothetical protein